MTDDTDRDEFLGWAGEAVRGKVCGVSGCQTNPVEVRNGRHLCAKHRDHYDHSTMGKPCDECGSRQWVRTPDAASVAVCAICDYVTYDDGILEGSWSVDTDTNQSNTSMEGSTDA